MPDKRESRAKVKSTATEIISDVPSHNCGRCDIANSYVGHLYAVVADKRSYRQLRMTGLVLHCRVSTLDQERKGNLKDQVANLERHLEELGIPVIDIFTDVDSGGNPDRPGLQAALECGRARGAPVIVESLDRLIRNAQNWRACLTEADFQQLERIAAGVPLLTLWDTDAPPTIIQKLQQARGQEAKGNVGGRPSKPKPGAKKQLRLELVDTVHQLHNAGYSLREIAKMIGRPHTTVHRWLKTTPK